MRRFRCLRPFALLLSILMLVYAFPFSTNALTTTDAPDITAASATDIGASLTDIIDTEKISGIHEVTDLREENVKHFALPDGSYTAVTYPSPVHRKDTDGNWQDIDNSLSIKAVKNAERYATDDLRVSFAKTYTAGEALFALTENGYTIGMLLASEPIGTETSTMALAPSENQPATVTNAEKRPVTERFDTIEEAAEIDNKSSIVYKNVKANTDLEYVLDGNDVKENIIVKSAGGSYVYRFTLSLTGLTATLLPSGDISLTDSETGVEKYTIPAPYMYDADGVLSYDVHYTLASSGSGNYTLTVTASSEWINAEDRTFPVTIDPTVTNSYQIYDTYVYSKAPSTNYNSNTLLPINDDTFVYSMWLIPYLPTGAIITNASMYLMPLNIESDTIGVSIYKMQEAWSSPSITWNSAQTDLTNFGMAYTPYDTVALSTDAVYKKVNITSLAQEWYADRSSNFGIALWKTVGTNNDVLIYSCEADSGKNMYYTVTYRLFEDGVYFIQNVATGKYMDVEGPSTSEGAVVQQWSFHGSDHSRWRLTHDISGNIKIQSVYSSRYITTNSASSSVTQTSTLNDYSTWAFQQTDSGNYKIVCPTFPLRGNNTISIPSATSGNGADLVMTTYTDDDDYSDEWKIYRAKDASLIALPETYDRSSYFSDILNNLNSIGYTDNFNNHSTVSNGMTEAELLQRMKYSKIVLIRTHGSKIVVQVSSTNGDIYLTRDELLSLPTNTFAGTQLIIYGACSTGEGGKNDSNLVTATVSAGARTVIGFEDTVNGYHCNRWCELFFEYYAEYYGDETMTYEKLCGMVVEKMKDEGFVDGYDEDGNLISTKNYVVAGESTFP